MGSAAARAGEKKPGFAEATAVVASAKFNFKPSRRVKHAQVSLGSYWHAEKLLCPTLEDNPKMSGV